MFTSRGVRKAPDRATAARNAPPSVSSVATATVPEGNSGDALFASIDVMLSAPSGRAVSADSDRGASQVTRYLSC